jgi:tetratricopeptide (TPR) repeat protein
VKTATSPGLRLMGLREVATACAFEGKFAAAEHAHGEAKRLAGTRPEKVLLAFDLAIIRRGQGRFREALEILDRAEREHPGETPEAASQVVVYRAQILCGFGRHKEALRALAKAGVLDLDPGHQAFGDFAGTSYAPLALSGEWKRAARMMQGMMRAERRTPFARAVSAMIAGMLLEVGGDDRAAKRAYRDAEKRFPPDRVCMLGAAAGELARREGTGSLEAAPYEAQVRSELFYWAARVLEKRGKKKESTRLMRLAVSEDPTRRWPAELARKWLKKPRQHVDRAVRTG